MTTNTLSNIWKRHSNIILLIFIILFATFLRMYKLGEIPLGLNQDEASMTVEAKSLLETGRDKWGYFLPSYFPSWGSGQNVLLSYLTVPFLYFFGVSIWSTRIVSALLGVLAIWIVYLFIKNIYNKKAGLVGALLLCILPWHLVASRWGLESNILPFFLLLGMYLVSRLLTKSEIQNKPESEKKLLSAWNKFLDYFTLVPFSLGLYGYGAGITVVPIIFVLVFTLHFTRIKKYWKEWSVSLGLFLITFLPLGLFVFKNYISKTNYDWEKYLPFSAPLLGITRLDQVGSDRFKIMLENYSFAINGFNDNLPWNTIPTFETIPTFLFPFLFLGVFFALSKTFQKNNYLNLALIWLFACLGNLALIPANVNRANSVFIPIIILIAVGLVFIYENLHSFKRVFAVTMTTILAVYFGLFSYNYFVIYPTKFNFPKDLEVPFSLVKDNKNPTLISNRLPIHYMYVLFYTSYPISEFQKNNKNTNYDIRFVGNFYIDPDYIQADKITDFDFMLSNSQNECLTTDSKVAVEIIIYQNDDWKVGNCKISYR